MQEQQIDFLNTDFSVHEIDFDRISEQDVFKITITQGLEEALNDLENLRSNLPKEQNATLLELCKNNVIDTITSQFGLASLFIDARDGGSVTTTHNFEKGITANQNDAKKYEDFKNNQASDWATVRKDVGYDEPLPKLRKEAFQNTTTIIDVYTGKPLPKDGRTHLDHIVSAKEIESTAKNHLFATPEERAKIATSKENLAFTDASLNQSKGDMKMSDFLKKIDKQTGQTKAQKYDINKEKALNADHNARNHIKSEINKKALKKYSADLAKTGANDAVNTAIYSAFGVVLRDLMQAIFIEIHTTFKNSKKESLKEIFERFKTRLSETFKQIKEKWKDIFTGSIEAGVTAFLSNILTFVINLFATTLKRFVNMIRAGFVSLAQALKILINPPHNMSQDEVNYQALKILTAGLIGALSLGLTEAIDKLLNCVPGLAPLMQIPISTEHTLGGAIAVTLSALCGGLLTTIALYFMDKARSENKESRLRIQILTKTGEIVQYKIAQTYFVLADGYNTIFAGAKQSFEIIKNTQAQIDESLLNSEQKISEFDSIMQKLKEQK
ncbi:putative membrane protein [Campylobacter mucosalis]|uniref:hypothetical protein n=1 Tax=Campylobacter mucosalis TaxID=202 RepID=UPI000ACFCBD7|nr:hypothetical protein [Campylobacter mucosalis]QKF62765.1 putative membrane protein [Campylobacter mucosalis]